MVALIVHREVVPKYILKAFSGEQFKTNQRRTLLTLTVRYLSAAASPAYEVPAYLLTRRQELFKLVERAAGPASEKQRREVFIWAAAFGSAAALR